MLRKLLRFFTSTARRQRRHAVVEECEPRILYSADLNPALWADAGSAAEVRLVAPPAAAPAAVYSPAEAQRRGHEIVFVDANVPDAQTLIDAVLAAGGAQADIEIVRLAGNTDGLQQITDVLSAERDLDAIHIISHGSAGQLQLGSGTVNAQTLSDAADSLSAWRAALNPDADILLYGCDVAAGTSGQAFIQQLAQATGADVAASTDATGSAARGGNWVLETETGRIEAQLAASAGQFEQGWSGLLSLTPQGDEKLVNVGQTNADQEITAFGGGNVAMAANGSYVVVYTDLNANGGDIYAQRYDAAGAAQGAAILVNGTTANTQFEPSVAMAADGRFVVTWSSQSQDSASDLGVYARLYAADGTASGAEFRVNTTVAGDQRFSKVGIDNNGNFVVAFTDYSVNGGDVYAQRYNAAGVAQGANFRVNTSLTDFQSFADIAVHPTSGDFIIVWESLQDGIATDVYGQRFNAAGVAQGSEFRVNITTDSIQESGHVAYAADGSFAVAWESDNGITVDMMVRRYDASGTALTGEITANTYSPNEQRWGDLAFIGSDSFVVTWGSDQQDGSGYGVYAQQFNAASGAKIGAELRVSTSASNVQQFPSIAIQGSNAVIVWGGEGTQIGNVDNAGVFMQRLNVNAAPTFARGDGIVTTAVGAGNASASSVTLQPDGKIIVAGQSSNGSDTDFTLTRYNADGTLDTSFGGGDGVVTTAIGAGADLARSVSLQPDGKIVVAGYTFIGSSNNDFALARYDADGTLDTTFGGGDGIVTASIGGGARNEEAFSVTVQPDGNIIVAGFRRISGTDDFALIRYTANGTLDTSFSGDGIVTTAIGTGTDRAHSVTVQPDGKIVVAGYSRIGSTDDFALIRYNANGTLDTSFGGGDGIVTTAIGASTDQAFSVTLQPDGKIVVAGYSSNGSNDDFALTRYNADGTLDTTFGGGDGIVTTGIGTGTDRANSVTVQSDGKIVVAGYSLIGSTDDFVLVRYNADGTLDTSFGGGDGIVTTTIGTGTDRANSVTVQPDGKIVVVGHSSNGTIDQFALVRYNADGSVDTRLDLRNTLDGALVYTENGTPVVLDANVQVYDAELSAADNFNGATLTLARNGGADAQDVFSATGTLSSITAASGNLVVGGTTVGTYTNSAGTLVFSFNASATNALVNAAMQQIAYANSGDTPPASVQIGWVFDDGNGGTNAGVTLQGLYEFDGNANDTSPGAAQNGTLNGNATYTNDATRGQVLTLDGSGSYVQIAGTYGNPTEVTIGGWFNLISLSARDEFISLSDRVHIAHDDSGSGVKGSVQIGAGTWQDIYSFQDIAGTGWHHVMYTYSDTDNVHTLYIDGVVVATEAIADSIDWNGAGDTLIGAHPTEGNYPNALIDDVRIYNRALTATEVSALANDLSLIDGDQVTITVTAVNDAPVVATTGTTLAYTENDAATAIDGGLTVSDADSANLSGATVTISSGLVSGQDLLAFTDQNGITGSWNAGTGVLTLTGSATVADYQAALRSVTYVNTSENPSTATRTVSFVVNDGAGNSTAATRNISITAVNDAPVVTTTGTALSYTENSAATAVDNGLTLSDVDNTNLASATVTISTGFASGQDVLAFTNQNGITGSWDSGTGVLTLTGSATVADYQAALRSITYFNSSDNPSTATRTVNFVVNDGSANSNIGARNISVAAVNDAPTGSVTVDDTTPTQGQTLTVSNTLADAEGLGSISYQWQRGGVDIVGATGATYVTTLADVGSVLRVVASYTDGQGTPESVASANTAAVANVNDAPTGSVTIDDTTPTQGQTLTASNTLVDLDGLGAITYQWQRGGVDIVGATGATYVTTQADVGSVLRVVASYTDGQGTPESVASANTAAVANVNDAPTGSVTIDDTTPTQGQTLTASNTLVDLDGLGAITYQWQRGGVDIVGATGATYVTTQADVGSVLRVVASYTDGQGTPESVASANTAAVANVNDAPTGSVTIDDTTPTQGQTLTASNTLVDLDGLGAITYQWQRGGVDIVGATGATYVTTQADVGSVLRVVASYTDGQGTAESVASLPTAAVANVNDAPTGSVSINDTTPTEGQTLTASNTLADLDGLGAITYQWQRGGVDIVGATAATYVTTQADVGSVLRVVASYTDGQGTAESVASLPTAAVANVNDAPTGSVSINDTTPTEGQTLTASNTLADLDGLGAITYQWQRGGVDIVGATAATYVTTQADVGSVLRVVASYTDGQGTAESVASLPTAAVANVNDAPTGSVSINDTTPTEGQTLTASNTLADLDGLGAITYQWQRGGVDIVGATAATYVTTQADVGSVLRVVASYTDGQGTPESVASANTAAVANVNDAPTGSVTIDDTTPTQGQTLTASNTLADADGLGSITYQWQRGGVDIVGATGATYVTTQADVGSGLRVVASYADGQGTPESVAGANTAAVVNVNDAPTGSVTIDDATPTQGQTLTASNTLADLDGPGAISYQWQRGGVDIVGAIGATYVTTQTDVGSVLRVVASYTDGQGAPEAVASANAAAVANVNDAPTGSIAIDDATPTQGQTLTASNTLSDIDGPGAITYQWQRGGVDIVGATGATYVTTRADVDSMLRVVASYTDGQGTSESVASANTAAVAKVNDVPVLAPPPLPIAPAPAPPPPAAEPAPPPAPASKPVTEPAPTATSGSTDGTEQPAPSEVVAPPAASTNLTPIPIASAGAAVAPAAATANAANAATPIQALPELGLPSITFDLSALNVTLADVQVRLLDVGKPLERLEFRFPMQVRAGQSVELDSPAILGQAEPTAGASALEATISNPISVSGVGVTAGFVWWLTRAGGLLTTVLMGVPAWRHVDLLPVLARADDGGDEEDAEDADSTFKDSEIEAADDLAVAELFDPRAAPTRAAPENP